MVLVYNNKNKRCATNRWRLRNRFGSGTYTFITNIVSCLISLGETINKFIVGLPTTTVCPFSRIMFSFALQEPWRSLRLLLSKGAFLWLCMETWYSDLFQRLEHYITLSLPLRVNPANFVNRWTSQEMSPQESWSTCRYDEVMKRLVISLKT